MSRSPRCSVLICTYRRAELLRMTLESLCVQSIEPVRFETVVVDDGSDDDTPQVVQTFSDRLDLRYEYQHNAGLASARNHALFLARGEIVLLQDDDDVADPHLIEEHLRTHQNFPEDHYAVLGFTNLSAPLQRDPVMHFVTEVGQFLFSYPNLRDGQVLDFSYFWGGRSSCKRRFLLEHGVFNPVFRFGCEDIELAYRLGRSGFQVVYNPRAVSTVLRPYTFDTFCERLVRQGRSNWVFSQLHADPLVQRWTEVAEARREWEQIGGAYDSLRASARRLDQTFRAKLAAGLPVGRDRELLHEAYWAAFRASKVKGIVERSRETIDAPPVHGDLLRTLTAPHGGGPGAAAGETGDASQAAPRTPAGPSEVLAK